LSPSLLTIGARKKGRIRFARDRTEKSRLNSVSRMPK